MGGRLEEAAGFCSPRQQTGSEEAIYPSYFSMIFLKKPILVIKYERHLMGHL